MQVGDQKRTLRRPEKCGLPCQFEILSAKFDQCRHAAAMGGAAQADKRPALPYGAAIMISVVALYHFAPIQDPTEIRAPLFALCEENGVKGTLLLSGEGVNGTIAGDRNALDAIVAHIRNWDGFATMEVKFSHAPAMPFGRLKVKVKREIVTMGVEGIDPRSDAGHYVEAKDWNALISDPDAIVIDTRNDFEVQAGTFENAVNPHTLSFRQFPAWFDAEAEKLRAEGRTPKFAMFCTGGIRCEKATAYVRSKGYDEVYHLKGGILKYLEEIPADQSKWRGSCFVFDEREGLVEGLEIAPK